jgi:hypothetical protein
MNQFITKRFPVPKTAGVACLKVDKIQPGATKVDHNIK